MGAMVTNWQTVIPVTQGHVYEEWHIAPAVKAGGFLFCSGVLGTNEDGTIPDEPKEQYRRVFANLGILLTDAGVDFSDVVDITSFHLDMASQIFAFGEVKDQYLAKPYPAWTAIEVAGIGAGALPGALVEMKVTVLLPE